jgi:hypothetical protein
MFSFLLVSIVPYLNIVVTIGVLIHFHFHAIRFRIWIQLLFEVMASATTGLQANQDPFRASVSVHGPLRLHFEPLKLLNFDFLMRIRIQHFTLMTIRIQLPKIMQIRIRNPYK